MHVDSQVELSRRQMVIQVQDSQARQRPEIVNPSWRDGVQYRDSGFVSPEELGIQRVDRGLRSEPWSASVFPVGEWKKSEEEWKKSEEEWKKYQKNEIHRNSGKSMLQKSVEKSISGGGQDLLCQMLRVEQNEDSELTIGFDNLKFIGISDKQFH